MGRRHALRFGMLPSKRRLMTKAKHECLHCRLSRLSIVGSPLKALMLTSINRTLAGAIHGKKNLIKGLTTNELQIMSQNFVSGC